eukprot:g2356.t1
MSTLLKEWLQGIGFNEKFESFEKTFANGYHFGQVLHLLKLQPDFQYFRNSSEPAIVIENYERLQSTFLILEVRFNARIVKRLIAEDSHVAANLLNAVRQNTQQKVQRSKQKIPAAIDGEEFGLSREFLQAQRYSSIKEAFYKGRARSFRATLDRALATRQSGIVNKTLSRFWKHQEQMEREERNEITSEKEEHSKQKSRNHANILQKFRDRKEAKKRVDEMQKLKHRSMLERKRQFDAWDKTATKELYQTGPSLEDCLEEAKEEIAKFEHSVSGADSTERDASCTLATSRSELIAFARDYEASLSQHRNASQIQTREALIERQSSFHELLPDLTFENEGAMLESIQLMSAEEAKICEELMLSSRESQLLHSNALNRKRYLMQQEELTRELCTKRDLVLWQHIKDEQQQKFHSLQQKRIEEEKQKQILYQQKALEFCTKVIWNIVKLVELKHEFKTRIGHETIPRRVKKEWSRLFVEDDSVLEITRPERSELPPKIKASLTREAVDDYFYFREDWKAPETVTRVQNSERMALWNGLVASEYHLRSEPPLYQGIKTEMKNFELKIAVIGPPCAGCSSVSKKLKDEFGIEVLNLKDKVEITNDQQDKSEAEPSDKAIKQLQDLLQESSEKEKLLKGFVLDGFPRNKHEAMSLEKCFSGLDLEAEKRMFDEQSKLAPTPLHLIPDINRLLESSLDVMFLLTVPNEQQLLERAMEKTKSKTVLLKTNNNNKTKNTETNLFQNEYPNEESLDAVTKRVESGWHEFQQNSADLKTWFLRFNGLLVEIDASFTFDSVYTTIHDHITQICGAKEASSSSTLALQRTQLAVEEAAKAQSAVEAASEVVESIARDLLLLKKTELATLEDLGKTTSDKGKHIVKSESLKLIMGQYNDGQKLLAEAESFLSICQESCKASNEASTEMTALLEKGQVHAESLKNIEQNCKIIETQLNKCCEASAKANEISNKARQLLTNTKELVDREQITSAETTKLHSSKETDATEETEIDSLINIQSPSKWSSNDIESLHGKWQDLEITYFSSLERILGSLRNEQVYFLDHFIHLKKEFQVTLEKEDEKHLKAVDFIQKFNNIHPDIRKESEVQGEWMLRCEELQEDLWKLCDKKFAETEQKLISLFNDGFKEEIQQKLENIHTDLIQLEVNKLGDLMDFSLQYAALCHGIEDYKTLNLFSCSSLELKSGELPGSITALLSPRSGFQLPDWLSDENILSKETKEILKLAFAFAESIRRDFEEPSEMKTDTKSKKGGAKQAGESEENLEKSKAALKAFIKEAVEKETEIVMFRWKLIARHSIGVSNELETISECTKQACETNHVEYHKQDRQSVAKFISMIKKIVKDGSLFSHPIHIQDGMLHTVPDSETDQVSKEETQMESSTSRFERDLTLLIKSFKTLSNGSYIYVKEAAKLAQECLMRPLELRKHLSVSANEDNDTEEAYSNFINLCTKHQSGYINWKAMICHLAVFGVPTLRHSTILDFTSAAETLENYFHTKAEPNQTVTTEEWRSIDFWFKKDCVCDVYNILWELFSQDAPLDCATGSHRVLDPKIALSFICLDKNGETGVQKFRALQSKIDTSGNELESFLDPTYLPCLDKANDNDIQDLSLSSFPERLKLHLM